MAKLRFGFQSFPFLKMRIFLPKLDRPSFVVANKLSKFWQDKTKSMWMLLLLLVRNGVTQISLRIKLFLIFLTL